MFKSLDVIKLSFATIYSSIILSLLYLFDVEISHAVQNHLVLWTHFASLPLVIVLQDTMWLASTLAIGIFFSVVMHTSVAYNMDVTYTEPLDIAFANLTLILVTFVVIFERIPRWSFPFMITTVILYATFWDYKIGDLNIYSIVSGAITIINLIYVVVQFIKPDSNRDKYFLLAAIGLGLMGCICFMIESHHSDKNYGAMHSIWHVCSYGSMYFAVRSIAGDNNNYRRNRVEFENKFIFGKIAFR
jgi:hypothetical protein